MRRPTRQRAAHQPARRELRALILVIAVITITLLVMTTSLTAR